MRTTHNPTEESIRHGHGSVKNLLRVGNSAYLKFEFDARSVNEV
jgi:hypothetical protein